MSKEDALNRISQITKQVRDLMKEATELADKEGVAFSVNLNGTHGTYWGKGIPRYPREKDFLKPDGSVDKEALLKAQEEWEIDNSDYGSHPYGYHGWANSNMNC